MQVALIVGGRGTGKTTLIRATIEALQGRGLAVAGFFQEGIEAPAVAAAPAARSGERIAYDAVRIGGSERVTVARRGAPGPGELPICSFSFDDRGFSIARRWLEEDALGSHPVDVIVVDEVSKAESRGRGHAAAIEAALRSHAPSVLLLAVRADELPHVLTHFELGEPIAHLEAEHVDALDPDALRASPSWTAFVDALAAAARPPVAPT